jgi:hypothetical protein
MCGILKIVSTRMNGYELNVSEPYGMMVQVAMEKIIEGRRGVICCHQCGEN